ncbi:MAG: strE [Chthonomonadaceae bacterium]|nr:strE [Chthonomonadaceae bacterium]
MLAQLPELASLAGRSVCVVGSTGQIGSVLIETLLRANASVLAAEPVRMFGLARTAPAVLSSGYTFLPISVTDSAAVADLPDFDYVIYVAGTASDYLRRRQETISTQVVGLESFLSRYANCRRFVFISSTRVYGRISDGSPITEETLACVPPMHTDNVYDSAKRLGESLCLWHARSGATPAVVARLSNIYGAQEAQRSETAISDFARQAAQTGAIALKGNPDSTRNWTCVLDIAQGILLALVSGRPGDAYNIGSDEHLSSHELAGMVAATFPTPVSVQIPSQPAPLSLQTISIEKARQELDFRPIFTFGSLAPLVVATTLRNTR